MRHDQRPKRLVGNVSLSGSVRSPTTATLALAEPVLVFANTHFAPAPPDCRPAMAFSRLASTLPNTKGLNRALGPTSADAVRAHARELTKLFRSASSDSP